MNPKIKTEKDKVRKDMAEAKRLYSPEDLFKMSEEVFSVVEITGVFNDASKICIYNAIAGEVTTQPFIDRWIEEKEFYLPVMCNDEICLRKIDKNTTYQKNELGILEPIGENFTNYEALDLVITPGIAFDRKSNRLGRGKGHYDKFLLKTKAKKMGICFDFQLLEEVPTDKWDIKMDIIASENELIW